LLSGQCFFYPFPGGERLGIHLFRESQSRKINLICGSGFSFGEKWIESYYDTLAAVGIERDENRVMCAKQYSSDFGVYGAIRALKDEGIRVPEDVSVIEFDNIESTNYYIPWPTTIHQPINELCAISGQDFCKILKRLDINKKLPIMKCKSFF
jgi:DNA-binding LacI/PurR family transcriptional regulator